MSDAVFTNVSMRESTKARLKMMAVSEGRSIAGLLALLVNQEYKRWFAARHKRTGATS